MKLSIRTKLMIGFVLVLVAAAVIGWRGIVGMGDINENLNTIKTDQFAPARVVANANIALIAWNRATLNHVLAENEQKMDEYEQIMLEQKAIMIERLERLSEMENLSERGKELVRTLEREFEQAEPIRDRIVTLSREGQQEDARNVMRTELRPIVDSMDVDMTEFLLLQEGQLDEVMNATDERYQQGFTRILWIIGALLFISLFIALFLSNTIMKGVNELVRGARLAAGGDFKQAKVTVKSNDELQYLGDNFNEMLDSLASNITQRQQAQEALRESNDWLSTTLASIADAVIATDVKGYVTLINPVAQTLTGWNQEDAVRKPIKDVFNIINGQTGKQVENPVMRVIQEGNVVRLANSTLLIAKDGTKRPIDDSGAPIRDAKGNITGVVLVFRDITEVKEMQEQLVRQEKLAMLGELAGGVGHELRNPLGAIKQAAYFLNMALEKPEPEVKETVDILQKEVATSERIISSLLDFARPKPVTPRKVDINDVVREALSHTTVPENVEVVRQSDEALPVIMAEPDQLRQVFENIIFNAIQAMPEGGQLVVKAEVPSRRWMAVSFADTGVGIPKEDLKMIFEPLFTTKAKGIGLGLAVTRTIVENHGGTIEAKSEAGKGSTFTVRLPMGAREEK